MLENYKCSCCEVWRKKSEIEHINHSTNEKGFPKQYIKCKECQKKGCIGICKIRKEWSDIRKGYKKCEEFRKHMKK